MDSEDYKARRDANAVQLLRRLDDIGAINLNVLLSKSAEIKEVISSGSGGGASSLIDDDWNRICYRFVIRIGARDDFDLVTVVNDLRQLGFDVNQTRQV